MRMRYLFANIQGPGGSRGARPLNRRKLDNCGREGARAVATQAWAFFKERIHDIGTSPNICTSFSFIGHMALPRIGQGAEVGGLEVGSWNIAHSIYIGTCGVRLRLRSTVSSFDDRLGTMQLDAPRSLVTAASRMFWPACKGSRLRWVLRWARCGFDVGAYARNP